MFCKNCGKEINDGAMFCKHCGFSLKKDDATATPCNTSTNTEIRNIEYNSIDSTPEENKEYYEEKNSSSDIIGIILCAIILGIFAMVIIFSISSNNPSDSKNSTNYSTHTEASDAETQDNNGYEHETIGDEEAEMRDGGNYEPEYNYQSEIQYETQQEMPSSFTVQKQKEPEPEPLPKPDMNVDKTMDMFNE